MKERVSYFDNAKLILICFVVLGHLIEPVYNSTQMNGVVMNFIYLFHMPAFIFISGYFAKAGFEEGWMNKIIKRYLLPYLCLQLLFIAYTKWINVGSYQFDLSIPYYTFWYLFAMAVWSITLKIVTVAKLNIKTILVGSIIIGILVGYLDILPVKFSVTRIVIFFPYYLMGYYFKEHHYQPQDIIKSKYLAVFILAVMILFLWLFDREVDIKWLYCNAQYDDMHVAGIGAGLDRLLLYVGQMIAMFSIFAIVPTKKTVYTSLGRNTFTIYILHGFLVKLFVAFDYYDHMTLLKYIFLVPLLILMVELLGKKKIPVFN
ncbi:arginine/ornithine antiporter ArcD [Lachnospiraceae bacterium KM106-2]|nr:arginine/ornithine antiporter ArcD [Lachnospiraceae bacterium KM106-2]